MPDSLEDWEQLYFQLRRTVVRAGFREADEAVDALVRRNDAGPKTRLVDYGHKLGSYFDSRDAAAATRWIETINESLRRGAIEEVMVELPEQAWLRGEGRVRLAELVFRPDDVAALRGALTRLLVDIDLISERDKGRDDPGMP